MLTVTEHEGDTIDMRAEQQKDTYINKLFQWVKEYSRLTTEQISTFDYKEKLLWARFKELCIVNKLLCLADSQGQHKVIPPKHLREYNSHVPRSQGRWTSRFRKNVLQSQRTILLAANEARDKARLH